MIGMDQLGLSMLIAAVVAPPLGISSAALAFGYPLWPRVALVIAGVALHQAGPAQEGAPPGWRRAVV